MGGKQGVDVLPVREKGGSTNLSKRHLTWSMMWLGIVEQRIEYVG